MKIEVIIKIVLESLIFVTSFLVVSTNASKVAMDNGGVMLENVTEHVRDFYAQVAPQAQIYFENAKDFTMKYGKIGLGKTVDLILDGIDLAYDGYLIAWPLILDGIDLAYDGYLKAWPLILDGIDLAYDGYINAWPYIKQGTNKTIELMDDEKQVHRLNFKWLIIFLAFTCYGILAEPSLEVSRRSRILTGMLTFFSTMIGVSIITVIVIFSSLYLSFAIHNCIQIHHEIVTYYYFVRGFRFL